MPVNPPTMKNDSVFGPSFASCYGGAPNEMQMSGRGRVGQRVTPEKQQQMMNRKSSIASNAGQAAKCQTKLAGKQEEQLTRALSRQSRGGSFAQAPAPGMKRDMSFC